MANTPHHPAARKPAAAPPPQPPSPGALEQLEAVLRMLVVEHERMLALTTAHRKAISEADLPALRQCMAGQSEITAGITALEKQRQAIVATLTGQRVGVPAPMPTPGAPRLTVSMLAKAAPEPVRARLLAVSDALRDLLNRLHREHLALRSAAETLSSHMEGVMRQVCRTISHAGTYARSGAIDSSLPVAAALDVRS